MEKKAILWAGIILFVLLTAAIFFFQNGTSIDTQWQSDYYSTLAETCNTDACCLSSVSNMQNFGYKKVDDYPEGICPEGYFKTGVKCPSSFLWCEQENNFFEIKIGEKKILKNGVDLLFTNVTEDSRCPDTVLCKWQGQATAEFILEKDGQQKKFNLTILSTNPKIAQTEALGQTVTLKKLEPNPIDIQPIPTSEYTATITINSITNKTTIPHTDESINCPQWTPYQPGWCPEDAIVEGKLNENGCRGPPQCQATIKKESYTACGCGCCGGTEPQIQCVYQAKGESLESIKARDEAVRQSPNCALIGCSFGTKYTYCEEPEIADAPVGTTMAQGDRVSACGYQIQLTQLVGQLGSRSDWMHQFEIQRTNGEVIDTLTNWGNQEHELQTPKAQNVRIIVKKIQETPILHAIVVFDCNR